MLCLEVPLNQLECAKRHIQKKGYWQEGYSIKKISGKGLLPLKTLSSDQKSELTKDINGSRIIESPLETLLHKKNYKSRLEVDRNKVALLPTSFDIIGNILITELKPGLEGAEKGIGEALMQTHKNVTTVLQKAGIHSGEFRTQKLGYLAGIETKETQHRENNVQLKLDVENVYFSPRLATERKRVFQQVRDNEDVLVMFSGCGPYSIEICKNTGALNVYAIEKNPIAAEYASINKKLNKCSNLVLIEGDVRTEIPKLLAERVPEIGLKSNIEPESIRSRLSQGTALLEIYLRPGDLENRKEELSRAIKQLKEKKQKVFLHMPHTFLGKPVSFLKSTMRNTTELVKQLDILYIKHHLEGYILHPKMREEKAATDNEKEFIESYLQLAETIPDLADHAYFENIMSGMFHTKESIIRIIRKTGIKNVCFDIPHAYNVCHTSSGVEEMMCSIPNIRYYHIADSKVIGQGEEEALPLGKGEIDMNRLVKYIRRGIIEVPSKDEQAGKEMIDSFNAYHKLMSDANLFDRILMPLPKGAEDFLDLAFSAAKKGTIIHFYDFEQEDELGKAADKIERRAAAAGKNVKVLDTVKCGQFAPGKFRVCVDFCVL